MPSPQSRSRLSNALAIAIWRVSTRQKNKLQRARTSSGRSLTRCSRRVRAQRVQAFTRPSSPRARNAFTPITMHWNSSPRSWAARSHAATADLHTGMAGAGNVLAGWGLPNDPRVQHEVGTRAIVYRNVLESRYRTSFAPIAEETLAAADREALTFQDILEEVLFVRSFD